MQVDAERERHKAEERVNDIFEPDILLPIQYFSALKRKRYSSGEHRLVIAIIQDAIECFQKHIHATDSKRRQLFVDAEEWIREDDYTETFSFNNICDLLGMNPDYLRSGLLSWRDRELARHRGRMLETMAAAAHALSDADADADAVGAVPADAVEAVPLEVASEYPELYLAPSDH